MKVMSYREGIVVDSPSPDHQYFAKLAQQMLSPFKLAVAIGLPGCGKTTFFDSFVNKDGCHTHWNRQPIFGMLFKGGERDEKYNSHIAEFEANIFPSLLARPAHQLLVDGLNRMPSSRQKILGCLELGMGKTIAVCFDGPPEEIVGRMLQEPRYSAYTPFELEDMVAQYQDTIIWPKYQEGFDEIYYLNTFGESGLKILKELVIKRKA